METINADDVVQNEPVHATGLAGAKAPRLGKLNKQQISELIKRFESAGRKLHVDKSNVTLDDQPTVLVSGDISKKQSVPAWLLLTNKVHHAILAPRRGNDICDVYVVPLSALHAPDGAGLNTKLDLKIDAHGFARYGSDSHNIDLTKFKI